ncbi:hypothetical protein HNR23_000199 [Nocardiopsis mwathae]|uniref:GerMN domain-containing protein n=1 Tax=Nocardiopsis mwathae TaxID=1472723 RepID=A0A7W9YDI3_9ACTN|nr:LpqB family beta-propeller domain-containing protein [Nocardiopsis mwathae]MBB6170139.1 hypothetical protein [Nocardiopsis mwathae]
MSHGPGRLRAAASGAVLALLLSACATVPTGGPVVEGAGRDGEAGDPYDNYVRMLPAGPQKGVGEEGLVRGFLTDMRSFEDDHNAAREYLMPARRGDWSGNGPVLIYDDMDAVSLSVDSGGDGSSSKVRVRSPQIATLDRGGQYLPAEQGKMIDVTFELARDDEGEWRIVDLPDELLLGRQDVDRAYRPLNLYYYNLDHSSLVPDPVFLPVSADKRAIRLVNKLVSGPTDWLDPAVVSSFPEDATAYVAYDSGRVIVELSSEEGGGDPFGMGAQLAWTLKQLPEVQGFSLSVNGEEVDFPHNEDENLQSGDDYWNDITPAGVRRDLSAYFTRNGQLWSLTGTGQDDRQTEARVEGAAGRGDTPLERHAVSLDERRVAGVEAGRDRVVGADLASGAEFTPLLTGGHYTSLSWDGYGNLWVVEDSAGTSGKKSKDKGGRDGADDRDAARDPATRVWLLRGGTDPVEVDAPALRDREVERLRVSRDGSRVAVITSDGEDEDGRLFVGRVIHGGDKSAVGALLPLAQELARVADVSWRGGDQLAVVGQRTRGPNQAFLVSLDGSTDTTSAGAPSGTDMTTVAAAPGRPLMCSTEDGQIMMTGDRISWQRVADGANPVYPG